MITFYLLDKATKVELPANRNTYPPQLWSRSATSQICSIASESEPQLRRSLHGQLAQTARPHRSSRHTCQSSSTNAPSRETVSLLIPQISRSSRRSVDQSLIPQITTPFPLSPSHYWLLRKLCPTPGRLAAGRPGVCDSVCTMYGTSTHVYIP